MIKRFLFSVAMITALISFGGCGSNQVKDNGTNVDIVGEDSSQEDSDNNKEEEQVKDNVETDSLLTQSLSDIVSQIYEIKNPGIKTMDTPLDLTDVDSVKYNTGLDDSSKIKEAILSEAMMSAQAYSMVLVRVNDANDAEVVAKEMLEGINPAKWICVSGDDLQIVTVDDLVLLIMVSTQLSDSVTSQEIVDAFANVSGKEFDSTLTK